MTIAAQYAYALFELVEASPGKSKDYLQGLRTTLERKGHQKLAPSIVASYQRLQQHKDRSARYGAITPESERTRVLLELYRTLVASA